jgi:hypothetical protein
MAGEIQLESAAELPDALDLGRADIALILSTCAREREHATLIPCLRGGGHALRFASWSPEEVVFDLPESRSFLRLEPLSACWLSFIWHDQPTGFLSQILRSEERRLDGGGQIALRPPTRLASEDLRSALRVSDLSGTELRVRITSDRRSPRIATPLDLSFSGMLLEMSAAERSELAIHEVVDLELSLGGQSAWLLGVVRRKNGRRVGIHFPEALQAGRIDPPRDLAGIIRRLAHGGART